jgi:hypothetical protein
MTRRSTAWLLFGASVLLIPLPYFVIGEGAVPVVRFALLGAVSAAYAGLIDGSGVAWPMTTILLLHVVVYSLVLAAAAFLVASLVPERARRWIVPAAVAVGFCCALSFDLYHTPFDPSRAYNGWLGLFR